MLDSSPLASVPRVVCGKTKIDRVKSQVNAQAFFFFRLTKRAMRTLSSMMGGFDRCKRFTHVLLLLVLAPSRDTSAIISLVLFLTTLGGIGFYAETLASTSQLTILGGFLSSLLFFFGLTVR